ncbi:hypothetical protein BO86DRAFT_25744 [Aspergillus japonicus CBS 114.51]|uniref:Uncharacterized protein n=1 Tax=Aspergillus japonicus CBS 114.51 TaxID=1448312 RepID=A0A8T8X7N9_ASPJA|nr:hypothetical protein BO86DRAFT_25744 [Aspergillus japonicus CBS 114.51]RAH84000.1 hypothetical protein BO86DRAFT_25744 [Aspergillus japonicus CBS 114.51]
MSRSLSMRLLLPLLPLPLPPVLRPAKRPPLLRLQLPPLLRKCTSTIVHSQSLGAIPILSFCIRASRHWSQFFFIPRFFLCIYCGLPSLQLLVPTGFNLRYVYDEQQKFHEVLVFLTAWVLNTLLRDLWMASIVHLGYLSHLHKSDAARKKETRPRRGDGLIERRTNKWWTEASAFACMGTGFKEVWLELCMGVYLLKMCEW